MFHFLRLCQSAVYGEFSFSQTLQFAFESILISKDFIKIKIFQLNGLFQSVILPDFLHLLPLYVNGGFYQVHQNVHSGFPYHLTESLNELFGQPDIRMDLKKKLWIKCNQLTLEALFTSQETSSVWVSSHTGRDCLADLAKNIRDLQSVSGFKRCSGCFIRFTNSRVTLLVFTLPPPPPQGKF